MPEYVGGLKVTVMVWIVTTCPVPDGRAFVAAPVPEKLPLVAEKDGREVPIPVPEKLPLVAEKDGRVPLDGAEPVTAPVSEEDDGEPVDREVEPARGRPDAL